MASSSTDLLDKLMRLLVNDKISFAEKSGELALLRGSCERFIANELRKRAKSININVCEFSQLQFPQSEQECCVDHFPVR